VISRKTRPQTPDLIKHCNHLQHDDRDAGKMIDKKMEIDSYRNSNIEKTIIVTKVQ